MRLFALAITLFSLLPDTDAQVADRSPVVLFSGATDLAASMEALPAVRAAGMDVRVITAPGVYLGTLDGAGSAEGLSALGRVVRTGATAMDRNAMRDDERIALEYLDGLVSGRFESQAVRGTMDWGAHPDHALEPPAEDHADESTDRTGGSPAPDWTCGNTNNSEYMAGTVCSSVFFVESNGATDPNTYTWTANAINDVKLQTIDAWSIWSYTASLNGTTVTAVMDFYEPAGGIPVQGYEPVTRSSVQDYLWIEAIMQNAGRTESGAFTKCHAFNSERRSTLGTDHAYCTFIAYNPAGQGAPSQFTDGRIGYAYLGGPYVQLLYKANGWTTSQVNRVYGHESAHVFHAFDEYTSSGTVNCSRSFNGRTNANFQGGSCNGSAGCVMINNVFTGSGSTRRWTLCSHTPYHLGWTGRLTPPTCTSPINEAVVSANPVILRWNRNGAPATAESFVKVYDRNTDQLVFCGSTGQLDTLAINLVNGPYRWTASSGNANTGSGYAGVISSAGLFKVNAPLHASFTSGPSLLCAGSTVQVVNTSTGAPTTWTWSFPGGTPSTFSGMVPPAILYSAAGTFNISLTVGDGTGTHTTTLTNAVEVTGGSALPFAEDFNGGGFPAFGWATYGASGQGSFSWSADVVLGCANQTSAYVNGFSLNGPLASAHLLTPRLDLTAAALPYVRFRYSYAQKSATNTESLHVFGADCSFGIYQEFMDLSGSALATNGGDYVNNTPWQPSDCAHWREKLLRVDALSGHIGQIGFLVFTQGGQNVFLDDVAVFNGLRLPLKVFLQGPYNSASGSMSDALRVQGALPLTEPATAAGYVFVDEGGPRSTTPQALAVTGNDALVDWAILEIREATDPTRIRYSRPVLVQRDGDVVDYDGTSAPRVGVPGGAYHVCIKHRNHLGAMTAAPVTLGNGMPVLDFTLPSTLTWGTDARVVIAGKTALWCGNTSGNNDLRYSGVGNDRDPILVAVGSTTPNQTVSGYLQQDSNLDGTVRYTGANNDRDPILQNLGSTNPNNVRIEQVP